MKILTPREHEVVNRVLSGLLNKEIASELGITERTVKAHRARIMAKMGAKSSAELIKMFLTIQLSALYWLCRATNRRCSLLTKVGSSTLNNSQMAIGDR